MKCKLYIRRDAYGRVQWASFFAGSSQDGLSYLPLKHRTVSTTKQLAYAMLQSGTRQSLFDAAWRMALQCEAVSPSRKLDVDDGGMSIEYAKQEAEQVEYYIGQLVNNEKSKFYIYG